MNKKKQPSKSPKKQIKKEKEKSLFKWIFFKLRFQETDKVIVAEELKISTEDRKTDLQNNSSGSMQTYVQDMKGETDKMDLSKIIMLVFQELGLQNEEDRELQMVEYKLNELTLNIHQNGNLALLLEKVMVR